MSSRRIIHCPACGAGYALGGPLVDALQGKIVHCAECDNAWVPFPATGFFAKLRRAKPAPIDLLPYLERKESFAEPQRAAPAPPPATREVERTAPREPDRRPPADDLALPPERPLVPDLPAGLAGASVEGTVLNLAAPGRGMQSAASSPLSGLQVGFVGASGKYAGKSYRVTKTPCLIGRTTGDLLIADGQVSGRHAQLDVLGLGHASLKDLASTNGTTVNGRPISTTALKHGDTVGFGGLEFRFVLRAEPRPGE